MNVVSRTDNYISNFLILRFNYPGTSTEVITFDNQEIAKDVGLGEKPQPEIHKSAAGYATKIAKVQPKRIEVTFRLAWPETIQKINKLVKYAGEKYVCDLYLNNVRDYPVTATAFRSNDQITFRTVFEFDPDIIFRLQGRGLGIKTNVEIPFVFWEAQSQESGTTSPVVITTQDGKVYAIKTEAVVSTSALPGNGGARTE